MAKSLDKFQPTLFEFPRQIARTGWHPVWTPTLLVVPWSFDSNRKRIENSQIKSVTFTIEKPKQIKVAGHPQEYNPIGVKPDASPNLILFEVTLTYEQLLEYVIDTSINLFYDQQTDGNLVDNPDEGDWMEFTNARGIQSRVEYLPSAEYFDLSSIEINVDNLPSDRYIASWVVNYFERIKSDDALFCINVKNEQKSKLDYLINHPGEIHEEMVKRTPSLYMEDLDKKKDFTVNLYRPFADILQDHFDESELFHGINWVRKIPPQLFPYLSYLIGVELPTQSGGQNLDKIRRRMLERGVELQKLKGSELAIKELFSILGFTVEIINLWINSDGTRFFAPNEPDPERFIIKPKDEIKSITVSQTDPMVANYVTSGFGDFEVPLLYHNKDNEIVINAFIVKNGSDAHDKLRGAIDHFIDDSHYLTKETIVNDLDGHLMLPDELTINSSGVEAFSRLVCSDIEVLSQTHIGLPVIRFDSVRYDVLRDRINLNFADYKDLSDSVAYIFVTYRRDKIIVPDHLIDNQSNRFDIKILSKSGEIESSLYDYLIDTLFKFKAFHSLLRKISYDAELRDFYNVTDFCNNAFLSQQRDSDANALMIPPACPVDECFITDECNEENARGGLRESDNDFRNIILEGLKEEYDRWHDVTKEWLDIAHDQPDRINWARTVSNIDIPIPSDEGDNFGQDRVSYDLVAKTDSSLSVGSKFDAIYQGTYLETVGTSPIILNIQTTKYQILSGLTGVGVELEVIRRMESDLFYIKMILNLDDQSDVRSKITKLDRLSTPDYCYKGRVRDFLKFDTLIQLQTTVRNRPCNLMAGTGIYYGLKCGRLDNITGWYNDYLKKSDPDLHYSNDLFFKDLCLGSPLRPGIDIEKRGSGFPGHRQLRGGLLEDFTHPTYKARPWDFADDCFDLTNPLNAKLVEETTGNENLIFDESDLIYRANHIRPDIPDNSGQLDHEFTHAVYTTAESRPYVDFDNLIHTSVLEMNVDYPVFETAKQCTDTGGYLDYSDGYVASSGELSFEAEDIWSERKIDGQVLIESDLQPSEIITVSATYSSEVLVEKESGTGVYNEYDLWRGYRYDCDCLEYPCTDDERACNYGFFRDHHGEYDFNNDHLEVDRTASLIEKISGVCYKNDGTITDWLNWEFDETGPKELEFKDEYGIQYKVVLEENEEAIDITCETFQPRVWGQEEDGYIANGKVFRKGILTNIRQVYILENGIWILNAEGTEQTIAYRQTNYDCDWPTPEDKFIHYSEYSICDEIEMRIPCGPHWTDPDENDDMFSVWSGKENVREWDEGIWDVGFWDLDFIGPEITGGGCAVSSFSFIDVWESYQSSNKYVPCVGPQPK